MLYGERVAVVRRHWFNLELFFLFSGTCVSLIRGIPQVYHPESHLIPLLWYVLTGLELKPIFR